MGFAKFPVIGGIAVPEVEINFAYFKGLDNVNLFYGAGTMKRDQDDGKRKLFPSEPSYLHGWKTPVKCSFLHYHALKMG